MKLALTNFVMLDGSKDMVPVSGKTMLVNDGIIQAILETDKIPETLKDADDRNEDMVGEDGKPVLPCLFSKELIRREYKLINLKGQYLMPGLINLHVHLALPGEAPKPVKAGGKDSETGDADEGKQIDYKALYDRLTKYKPILYAFRMRSAGFAKTHLLSGTTTIRTVGGIMTFDTEIRDAIAAGKMMGPRVLASNMAVSVPGGHMAGSLALEATSPEEAVADVRRIAATKPDLIKLMITGGVMDCEVVGEPGILKMPPEMVRAAVDEAHRLGFPVAAHVESAEGVKVALRNGVDTIEHGAMPDEEMMELFARTGAALISTTSPAVPYALFDRSVSQCTETAQINGKALMKGMIACTKACLKAGVRVGLGTDCSCPFITHYDMWRELVYFHKWCGASNTLALHTATLGNAEIAGIDQITGSIEVGKSADFIVTRKNPLDNLRALRRITMVGIHGKVICHPKVRHMKDVDKQLNKFC